MLFSAPAEVSPQIQWSFHLFWGTSPHFHYLSWIRRCYSRPVPTIKGTHISFKLCPTDVEKSFSWNPLDFSAPPIQEYNFAEWLVNWTPSLCSPNHFKVAWLKPMFGKWAALHEGCLLQDPGLKSTPTDLLQENILLLLQWMLHFCQHLFPEVFFLTFPFLTQCRSRKAEAQVKTIF